VSGLYSDTDPEVEALQIELWRHASPTHKMNMLAQLNVSARRLALAGLRARYPQASETIHRETMFKVDIFIPRQRPFLRSQLARAQRQSFTLETEVSARFASPEDIILSKPER